MPPTIGILGGVPPSIGGGGLEVQIDRTIEALRDSGLDVFRVSAVLPPREFDVLHAFGSEPDVWHTLRHWTRNRRPLVVSPVIVVSPGLPGGAMRLLAALPGPLTGARMRREIVCRADALIALNHYERGVIERLRRGRMSTVEIVPNGVARVVAAPTNPTGLASGTYALMVGAITRRKAQRELLAQLAGEFPIVLAGRFDGTEAERSQFEATVQSTGAVWLGHVDDASLLQRVLIDARALLHPSRAEGQSLAVTEALAAGTPVLASNLPSHRELHSTYPTLIRTVEGPKAIAAALRELDSSVPHEPAPIPTWHDVARRLSEIYTRVALASVRSDRRR